MAKKLKEKAGPRKGGNASQELRQAVLDLGGDEEDLKLISGVDENDEEPQAPSTKVKGKGKEKQSSQAEKGNSGEKALRTALGAFMKDLDFAAFSGAVKTQDPKPPITDEVEEEEDADSPEESEDEDEDVEGESSLPKDEDDSPAESPTAVDPPKGAVPTKSPSSSKLPPAARGENLNGKDIPATPYWPSLVPELPPPAKPLRPLPPTKLASLRDRANDLLNTLPSLPRSASSSADAAFISQVLQSGTHQDKLAALVLMVRESPIHSVKELTRLRSMTGWKEDGTGMGGGGNKDQRVAVVKALADWWVSGGGKKQGKLRYFADQPLLAHPGISDRHLVVFAFEDFLKRWFFNILQVLESLSHDTLPFVKTQTLHIVFQLLSGNAEQEQNLLRLGVNKLGDIDKSVASKTSHHLLQLLQMHPAMKAVIAREISALVLKPQNTSQASTSHVRFDEQKKNQPTTRPEGSNHARYYGLITLNQITLTAKDQETAAKVVEVYFEIFREILGNGKDDEEEDQASEGDHVEKVAGKVGKWRGRRKGAKDKRKKQGNGEASIESSDAKLVAAILTGINRALPFATLDDEALHRNLETLFKITHAGTFNTSIQSLNLIFQVSRTRPDMSDRFYRTLYDSLFDERLVTSSKQAMYLNLLFKAMKVDTSPTRVMAFVKRLLQMLGLQQPPFICGALYLLGELFSVTPGLRRMLIEPEDNEDEHFVDADKPQDNKESSDADQTGRKTYDGRKREPEYANADSSCLWELLPLLDHFHPSVSLQAEQLLLSKPLSGSSDISMNTLVSFLDRFVYRNPKKNLQAKGASIMQPAAAGDKSGMIVMHKGAKAGNEGYVNSEAFWRKKIEDVPVDQLFFHKFFSTKLAQQDVNKKKAKVDDGGDSDIGSALDSDAEENEVWKAMQASMPGADEEMGLSDDEEDSDDDEEGDDHLDGDTAITQDGEVDAEGGESSLDEEDEEGEEEEDMASGSESIPSFAEGDDDLIPSDEEMPDIPLDASVSSSPEPEITGKRKRNEERKERRKKRKELPVFGSYEDYAKLIEQGEEINEE